MNLGNFTSEKDYQNKMDRYKETLKLQIKNANREAQANRTAWSSNGEFKPQPVPPTTYKSIEEEQMDRSLQLQNAQKSLNMVFKYPADAKRAFDLIIADFDPAEFNRYLPEFLTEIKNVPDITPSLFFNQWERFITIMRSRGDNFVKIGVNDDKAKILLNQQKSRIEKFLKEGISPEAPSFIKSRISYLLNTAVETNDENEIIYDANKLLDKLNEPLDNYDVEMKQKELEEKWIKDNREKFAEFGISEDEIKIPPNVKNRFIKEASNEILKEKKEKMIGEFLANLDVEKIRRYERKIKGTI
jgi:hypothetical protein